MNSDNTIINKFTKKMCCLLLFFFCFLPWVNTTTSIVEIVAWHISQAICHCVFYFHSFQSHCMAWCQCIVHFLFIVDALFIFIVNALFIYSFWTFLFHVDQPHDTHACGHKVDCCVCLPPIEATYNCKSTVAVPPPCHTGSLFILFLFSSLVMWLLGSLHSGLNFLCCMGKRECVCMVASQWKLCSIMPPLLLCCIELEFPHYAVLCIPIFPEGVHIITVDIAWEVQ